MNGYLAQFDKAMDEKAKQLYREKFLMSVRMASTNNRYYVQGRCAAEMKKSIIYTVDVVLDASGAVCESQCECGAGMGPDAHCKHVCCLLYGMTRFSTHKEFNLRETCTEKLQTFHQCKRFKGSPMKAESLTLRERQTQSTISAQATFDPRPAEYRNMNGYSTYFKNQCINFACSTASPSSMPILHMFPPANPYAVSVDHQYCTRSDEEKFIERNNLHLITQITQQTIEVATREQSASSEWFRVRSVRITSSNFGEICKSTERCDLRKLARRLCTQPKFHSAAVNHGLKYEPVAVEQFESISGLKTSKCGTFVSLTHPYLCSSPDRIVDDQTVLEVKCPFTAKDQEISHVTVPYLKMAADGLKLDRTHNYYYQVQGQMHCSGRKQCIFVVFTLIDIHFETIDIDDDFVAAMLDKLQIFYDEHYNAAVANIRMFKDYDQYHFDY